MFAGRFYPDDRDGLIGLVEECFAHPLGPGASPPERHRNRKVRGIVVPHAGMPVSGPIAAHSFRALEEGGHRDAYIVIGPDHYGQPYDLVTCSDSFLTPMGECRTCSEIVDRLRKHMPDSRLAHSREHSIEVILPFLQHIDPDAEIVPIIMGDQSMESAKILADLLRESIGSLDVTIIASSDLMHYVPCETERMLDSEFISAVSELDVPAMYDAIRRNRMTVCGYGPIAAAIMASGADCAEILMHGNSWDTIHRDRESVVGYMAAKFV